MSLEHVEHSHIAAAIIATVVPPTLFNLQHLCRKYFKIEPLVVAVGALELGMRIDLPNPSEAGADRIVNAVAAHAAHPGDLIVVDFGTATTFDVVGADGSYQGGVIAPGINLSMDALYAAAAKTAAHSGRATGRQRRGDRQEYRPRDAVRGLLRIYRPD